MRMERIIRPEEGIVEMRPRDIGLALIGSASRYRRPRRPNEQGRASELSLAGETYYARESLNSYSPGLWYGEDGPRAFRIELAKDLYGVRLDEVADGLPYDQTGMGGVDPSDLTRVYSAICDAEQRADERLRQYLAAADVNSATEISTDAVPDLLRDVRNLFRRANRER